MNDAATTRPPRIGVMGRHVRPHPPWPPGRSERGRELFRPRRGRLRADRASVAEVGCLAERASLSDDRDRDRLEPAVHGEPGRHRSRRPHLHDRHPARSEAGSDPTPSSSSSTGADAVAQILSWRDHDELWELAHFVAVSRPGHVLSTDGLPSDNVRPTRGAGAVDLVDGLPRTRYVTISRSGTWSLMGSFSTSRSITCRSKAMSTSDQQGQGPLTRKQLREIRLTGSTRSSPARRPPRRPRRLPPRPRCPVPRNPSRSSRHRCRSP